MIQNSKIIACSIELRWIPTIIECDSQAILIAAVHGAEEKNRKVNLSRVPDRTTNEVRLLVEAEVCKTADASLVQGIESFLVEPRTEMRTWGWTETPADYPVWIVAESSRYDYGIAFSDYGFAPERPWGLVFLSHTGFDADYCWYPTLEMAYRESRLIEEHDEEQTANRPKDTT